MKLKMFTALVGAAFLTGAASAADPAYPSVSVSTPTTPAPVIATTSPSATHASAPNQIVYTPRLPSPAELTNAAAAQGLMVERLEQSATQIVAVYKTATGQLNTVAYQTLPPASATAPALVTQGPAVATQPPTVVYETAPNVVYYDSYDPFYYPRVWYPPVSVRLGLGFGFHGGGFRGGFRHWR